MAKKTNKTSHVMDLLTNGSSEEAVEPVSEAASFSQDKRVMFNLTQSLQLKLQ